MPRLQGRRGLAVQVRLLTEEEYLVPLYRRLQVPVLDVTMLFVKVYLPAFGLLEEASQRDLLAYVASHWRRLQEHPDLLQTLSDIPFVPTGAPYFPPPPPRYRGGDRVLVCGEAG